jgi:TetR/AcrR family transcriptional repressor of nem operon
MRYPKQQKEETRQRILRVAAKMFRESGYDGIGVDGIMKEAGLTAGGFYAHFASKEALFAEAMSSALEPGRRLPARTGAAPAGADALDVLVRGYLSRSHRDSVGEGCPLPALTPDIARKSDATRESYEQLFLRFLDEVEDLLSDHSAATREHALAIIAQCVGGLMLARAVKSAELSDQILKSCRSGAMKLRKCAEG